MWLKGGRERERKLIDWLTKLINRSNHFFFFLYSKKQVTQKWIESYIKLFQNELKLNDDCNWINLHSKQKNNNNSSQYVWLINSYFKFISIQTNQLWTSHARWALSNLFFSLFHFISFLYFISLIFIMIIIFSYQKILFKREIDILMIAEKRSKIQKTTKYFLSLLAFKLS